MTVFRIKKTENFVIIHKGALEDPNLSFKAKGLWAYCMSRPNDWTFKVTHLATVSKESVSAIRTAILELENSGYIKKIQETVNGRFQPVDYEVYETPNNQKKFTLTDFPQAENPQAENRTLLSIDKRLSIEDNKERERGDAAASLPPPPAPSFFQKGNIKIREDKLKDLIEKYGETLIKEYIERLEDYSETNQKKFKQYSCHAAVIRTWIKRDGCQKLHQDKKFSVITQPASSHVQRDVKANSDFKWVDSFLVQNRNLQRNGLVEMYDKFISFPSVPEAKFYYGENAFREKVKNSFRKLDIHGID